MSEAGRALRAAVEPRGRRRAVAGHLDPGLGGRWDRLAARLGGRGVAGVGADPAAGPNAGGNRRSSSGLRPVSFLDRPRSAVPASPKSAAGASVLRREARPGADRGTAGRPAVPLRARRVRAVPNQRRSLGLARVERRQASAYASDGAGNPLMSQSKVTPTG